MLIYIICGDKMDKTRRGILVSLSVILTIFLLSCRSSQDEVVIAFTQETDGVYTDQITQTPSHVPNLKPTATTTAGPKWQYLGGPRGGIGYDIRIHPLDYDILWVTDAFAGAHKSMDGGQTWFPINDGIDARRGSSNDAIPIFTLAVDPNNPNVIWAGAQGTLGVYKSVNGGATWESKTKGITRQDEMEFRGFTVDPNNSEIVFCGGNYWDISNTGAQRGFIYKSVDGGETWNLLIEPKALVRWIIVDPTNSNIIYASTGIFDRLAVESEGVLKSTDGGLTWKQINNGLTNLAVGALAMHPTDPLTLIAGTGKGPFFDNTPDEKYGGVFITHDGGENWKQVDPIRSINNRTEFIQFSAVAFAPSSPNIVYADAGDVFLRSNDGGVSWDVYRQGGNLPLQSPENRGKPIALTVHPENPDIIYMNAYAGGVFLSTDGGKTWVDSSKGMSGARTLGLAIDPTEPAYVVAATNNNIYFSYDAGSSWRPAPPQPSLFPIINLSSMAIDPADRNHLLAGEEVLGQIYESHDGGLTWKWVMRDRKEDQFIYRRTVFDLAFAPSSPEIAYAAIGVRTMNGDLPKITTGQGIYKSADGGTTWNELKLDVNSMSPSVIDIAVHPQDPQIAYIATLGSGIYKTVTAGDSWTTVNQGLQTLRFLSLAIDSRNPDTLYAGSETDGIWESEDGGESWKQMSTGLPSQSSISSIVIDPASPLIIYASDMFSGVYRSLDGGSTWQAYNSGLDMRAVNELAISADGQHLFAATDGRGVFRIDLDGNAPPPADAPDK